MALAFGVYNIGVSLLMYGKLTLRVPSSIASCGPSGSWRVATAVRQEGLQRSFEL